MSSPSTLPWKLSGARAQQLARLLHHVVALDLLGADVEQADARARLALHRAHERRAHDGELQQLLGRAVGVGAEVEHVDAGPCAWAGPRRWPAGRCRAASSARTWRCPSARRCCPRSRRPARGRPSPGRWPRASRSPSWCGSRRARPRPSPTTCGAGTIVEARAQRRHRRARARARAAPSSPRAAASALASPRRGSRGRPGR